MKKTIPKKILKKRTLPSLLTGVLLCFMVFSAHAGRVTVEFRQAESTNKSNELASNMLRIVNGSDRQLSFYLGLSLPAGWVSIKSSESLYRLQPGDSMFIPVKLVFKGTSEGNVSYVVSAMLLSEAERMQFASASWYLQITKNSDWVATVNKKEAFFINNSDTSSFALQVRNTGNAAEWFSLKLLPHFQLEVFNIMNMDEVFSAGNFFLPPSADTTFHFIVRLHKTERNTYQTEYSGEESRGGMTYPLRIALQTQHQDNTPDRAWKAVINFKRNSNEVRYNEYSRKVLPLTAELRMENLMKNSTSLNLNMYGTAEFSKSRSLIYRWQTFFANQFYELQSYKGDYYYLSYLAPRTQIELGSITGWGTLGLTPSGKGISGIQSFGKHRVGLLYIQSPDFNVSPSIKSIGARHDMELKKLSLSNYIQQSVNGLSKTNAKTFATKADFRFRHQHIFSARMGLSTENHYGAPTPFTKNGMGASFNYTGLIRKFSVRVATDFGSPYYTGYQGIFNLNYGASYKRNEKYTWTLNNALYRQNPVYFDALGNQYKPGSSRSDRYELRLSINNKSNNYMVRAAYYLDDLLSIRYKTRGAGFDFHPVSKSNIRFSSTLFASYIKLIDYDIKDYFTMQLRSSFRYKSLTTNIRYNYGPYQAYEHLQFAEYGINHQSIYANAYYGFWIHPGLISMEPSINYSYETLYKKGRVSLRPEIFYFSKTGWTFNAFAEFMHSSQKISRLEDLGNMENPQQSSSYQDLNVGIGLKKSFGIPLPGKRFCTVSIVVFKDLNGNMKQDKNEEALENMLINIKPVNNDSVGDDGMRMLAERGEDVITDAKGRVFLRNLSQGKYIITTRPLVENSRWFPGEPMEIILDRSKEIVVPFSRGVQVTGSISVDYSLVSSRRKDLDLSRIRVSAVDSAGRVYSGLTGSTGNFELYLPVGDYRISMNQSALDDNFIMEQNMILLTLTGNTDSYNINFHLREKERSLNVKKFTNDGTLIEEKK